MKNVSIPHICIGICVGLAIFTFKCTNENYRLSNENQRLKITNDIYYAEHRILKDEIAEHEKKPTYEQGQRDLLVRLGGPQNGGAYQDGWDDACKVVGGDFAMGYHTCQQQFGYQLQPHYSRFLISKQDKKEEQVNNAVTSRFKMD